MHLCSSSFMLWIFAAVNIPQTNIIPLWILLLSVEKLPILQTAVFQTFLPTSDSEFSAALDHTLDLEFGLPVMEKYFDIDNFFKRSNFSQCLCCVVFRVSYKKWMLFILWWCCWVGHWLTAPHEHYVLTLNGCFVGLVPNSQAIVM